jgi:hypothetical protein
VRILVNAILAGVLASCASPATLTPAATAAPTLAVVPSEPNATAAPPPQSPPPPAIVPSPTATAATISAPTAAPPTLAPQTAAPAPIVVEPAGPLSIRVSGNHFLDGSGRPLRLIGVSRDGSEYMCLRRGAVFDGPSDDRSIAALTTWGINAVRVPLNEDCWLGINGAGIGGAPYQTAIRDFVARLHRAGFYVILDLHWSAPGTNIAANQQAMADADHSVAFWSSVASAFADDPAVVFDLFNEPFVDAALGPGSPDRWWGCWLNGCQVNVLMSPPNQRNTVTWQTVGMQQLVDAVRAAGARQPIMLGGVQWSNDLRGILDHLPQDPARQLAISWHEYDWNPCRTAACWNDSILAAAQRLPVVTGEFGEGDCGRGFIDGFLPWADQAGLSYLAWAWVIYGGDCHSGFSLIAAFDGTPSAYGAPFRDHFRSLGLRQ